MMKFIILAAFPFFIVGVALVTAALRPEPERHDWDDGGNTPEAIEDQIAWLEKVVDPTQCTKCKCAIAYKYGRWDHYLAGLLVFSDHRPVPVSPHHPDYTWKGSNQDCGTL